MALDKSAQSRPAHPPASAPRRRAHRELSAGFVLFRQTPEGPLYLLLDSGKHWGYPKGHLEAGETAWRAAVRELREETGIRRVERVGRFQRQMHYRFRSSKKGAISKTVTYFLGCTPTAEVMLSDEHEAALWLPYEEALRRLTYGNARALLRAAQRALGAAGAAGKAPIS